MKNSFVGNHPENTVTNIPENFAIKVGDPWDIDIFYKEWAFKYIRKYGEKGVRN